MARIAGIGIAALDIINSTQGYPEEDSEVRATAQQIRRGGNATNTLVVLSQLGHHCYWAGSLGDDSNSQLIYDDLQRYAVDTSAVRVFEKGTTPTSYIILNQINGSRSIVHYRDLPEYTYEDFCQHFTRQVLSELDWLHFEGRNVADVKRMIATTKALAPQLTISVEIEKDRAEIKGLLTGVDVVVFSRQYALSQHFSNADDFLQSVEQTCSATETAPMLICTWGAEGATLRYNSTVIHEPALAIDTAIDSIGAGDTFNAGFIHGLVQGNKPDTALKLACALASKKCAQIGFEGLGPL